MAELVIISEPFSGPQVVSESSALIASGLEKLESVCTYIRCTNIENNTIAGTCVDSEAVRMNSVISCRSIACSIDYPLQSGGLSVSKRKS